VTDFDFNKLLRANPDAANCAATIRQQPAHFQVDEQLPFSPSGEGGHVMLQIRKTGSNTDWIARQLAEFAGVDEVAIGYAGLKDRHAVTTQWFTVKVEGIEEPDWSQFQADGCDIVTLTRHNKKLKRGVLSGNHFHLVLTDLLGEQSVWEHSLERIAAEGVPNYFAEQRFGRQMANLAKAEAWFNSGRKPKKRQQKSMILSAARSWLFNQCVSARIEQNNWQQWLPGDVMQLNGTGSVFVPESDEADIAARLASFDIHPTAPLWGRGRPMSQADCLATEQTALAEWQSWQQGLEQAGLKQERRALRVRPEAMSWAFKDNSLSLRFFLPAGSYATAVMRELADVTDASQTEWNSDAGGVSQ
jgi:tRNA pseudouridine13 synthase